MVAVSFYEELCSIGHVGDSRVYRWRDGKLQQMTEDHSLLNDYIKMRPEGMTPEEIEAFPHKNIIVRALGMRENVQVDVSTEKINIGDLYLLCSDGLSGMITDPDMNQIISEAMKKKMSLDLICERLIQEANKNGGTDNITVLLALVEDQQLSEQPSEDIAPSWQQDALPQEDTPETKEVSAFDIQQALMKAELKEQDQKTLNESLAPEQASSLDSDLALSELEDGKTLNLQPSSLDKKPSIETDAIEIESHTIQDDMPTINESMPQVSASDLPTLKLKTPDPAILKTTPVDDFSTIQEMISPLAIDSPTISDQSTTSSEITETEEKSNN
jgi:serine/threonine protein phosphatase PrpC